MDLVNIQLPNQVRMYSFLSVAWGLIADVDYESERLRWMGGTRFVIYTLLRIASEYGLLFLYIRSRLNIALTHSIVIFAIAKPQGNHEKTEQGSMIYDRKGIATTKNKN